MKVYLTVEVAIEDKRTDYYEKDIEMSGAPYVGLSISEEDVVFTIASVIYNINDDSYYCRIRERTNDLNDPSESWEFLVHEGWKKK